MCNEYLLISNGVLLTPGTTIPGGAVLIRNGRIADFGFREKVEVPPGTEIIEAGGNLVAPGMIDIHVNGAMGADATNAGEETFGTMGAFFVRHGVTSYLATVITTQNENFIYVLSLAREYIRTGNRNGAELLGIHMEGPYISPGQSGAHPREYLALPVPGHYLPFLEYSDVLKKVTLAPELEGAAGLVKELRDRGIVAAAGHTNGIYPEMIGAIDAGITHATHFFCNMSNFRRENLKRVAGAAETLLYDDRVSGELIGDGWHLDNALMNLLVRVKGVEKTCFVTDAMPAAGMPDGKYFLGNVEAVVEKGVARLPDNSAYAGSVTTMDVCLRHGIFSMGLPIADALRMTTLTPAEIIGVSDRKGSIAKGKDADLMILDDSANVIMTIAGGKVVYRRTA
jgi:N-acetylglucosamine-6-phosphate deacetylase